MDDVNEMKFLKYDMRNVMLIVLTVIMIGMLFIFLFATKDGQQCLQNPLIYGIQKAQIPYNPESYGQGTGKVYGVLSFENPALRNIYFDNETISTFAPKFDNTDATFVGFVDLPDE